MRCVILVGASGLAREAAAAVAGSNEYKVTGLLDDDVAMHGTEMSGIPVLGGIDSAADHEGAHFVVCTGSGGSRQALVGRLSQRGVGPDRYATIIGDSVDIAPGCTVGPGSILLGHTVLTADVAIGRHVVLMPNVVCTHDNHIDDFATLCAGVALGGQVSVGARAYLGMNASVRQRVRVGAGATLGMGSVLLTNLPDEAVWAGNPACEISRKVS